MKLVEYVPLALRTEKPLPTASLRMEHACMGLITEVGEFVTEIKRTEIYKKELDGERKGHICEEIGDVLWYVAILLDTIQADVLFVQETLQNYSMGIKPEDNSEDKLSAMALVSGEHVGRICHLVMACEMKESLTQEDQGYILASVSVLLEVCRVLAEHCGSTLEACMDANIAKLRVRYPDAYSNEAAEARADKAGADARNS